MVERGNCILGDSLRTLLLRQEQEEWDLLLPQIMRAFSGTPPPFSHWRDGQPNDVGSGTALTRSTTATAPPAEITLHHEYCKELVERLGVAHEVLREQQMAVRQEDQEEPSYFHHETWYGWRTREEDVEKAPSYRRSFKGRIL